MTGHLVILELDTVSKHSVRDLLVNGDVNLFNRPACHNVGLLVLVLVVDNHGLFIDDALALVLVVVG